MIASYKVEYIDGVVGRVFDLDTCGADEYEVELCAAVVRGHLLLDNARDLADPALRTIYSAAIELDRRGDVVTATDIVAELRATGELRMLNSSGGLDLVVALVEHRPLFSSLSYYARCVRETARRRRICMSALELHQAARDGDAEEALLALARAAK